MAVGGSDGRQGLVRKARVAKGGSISQINGFADARAKRAGTGSRGVTKLQGAPVDEYLPSEGHRAGEDRGTRTGHDEARDTSRSGKILDARADSQGSGRVVMDVQIPSGTYLKASGARDGEGIGPGE